MTDYAKTAARADQSLRRKGGIVTLRREAPGDYDPEAGGPGPGVVTEYLGTGVTVNYDMENIDGTLIQRGDQQLLFSPLRRDGLVMPAPTTADLVLIGGVAYTVKNVETTRPVDVAVLHTLQLRGV